MNRVAEFGPIAQIADLLYFAESVGNAPVFE